MPLTVLVTSATIARSTRELRCTSTARRLISEFGLLETALRSGRVSATPADGASYSLGESVSALSASRLILRLTPQSHVGDGDRPALAQHVRLVERLARRVVLLPVAVARLWMRGHDDPRLGAVDAREPGVGRAQTATGTRLTLRVVILVLVAVLSGAVATVGSASRAEKYTGCNVRLKGLKMLSDPQRKLVNLHPKNTTVAAIDALPQPHPTPKTRSTPFSRQVWRVPAQITEFKVEGDGDIHLILFGEGAYTVAEMPAAKCIPRTARDRKAMIAVRKKFESKCGKATKTWQPLGAVVTISGVGFFDVPHSQNPHAVNFAELHPVTALKIASGC